MSSGTTLSPLDWSPLLPEVFSGIFRVRRCAGRASDPFPVVFKANINLPNVFGGDYSFDPVPQGVTGSVQMFYDECLAYYSMPSSPPDNLAALDALVNQIAQDFILFRSFSVDLVYLGMNAIVPVAIVDYIEFAYDADEPADDDNQDDQVIEMVEDRLRPNCYTRIRSEPWSGYPERFQHFDTQGFASSCINSNDKTPGILMISPGPRQQDAIANILVLEDGRLRMIYAGLPVGLCAPCDICVRTTICGGRVDGIAITITFAPPTIEFTASPTGHTATATATVIGGVITVISITSGGSGYTSTPLIFINFSGGNGMGATAHAVLTGDVVTLVVVDTGGSGYTTADLVDTCSTTTQISAITITNQGTGYTSAPTITFTPTFGSGGGSLITLPTATATVAAGKVTEITITDPGAYTGITFLAVNITGGGGSGAHATTTLIAQCCITILSAAYYVITGVPPTASLPQNQIATKKITNHYICTHNVVNMDMGFANGQITVIATDCAIRNPMTGLITNPSAGGFGFQIKTPGGTVITTVTTVIVPTATVPVGSYFVHYVSGYHFGSNPPDQAVTVGDCPPNNSKTVTVEMQPQPFFNATCPCFACPQEFDPNGSLTLHDPSFGYTVPIVTNSSGAGTDALKLVTRCAPAGATTHDLQWASVSQIKSNSGVAAIILTNGGSGYVLPGAPGTELAVSVGFSGGSSRFPATAKPVIHYTADSLGNTPTTYKITSIEIDYPGCWYLTAPTVIISPPTGPGAGVTATATVDFSESQEIVYGFNLRYSGLGGSGFTCSMTTGIFKTGTSVPRAAWYCGNLASLVCSPLNIQIDMGSGGGGRVCVFLGVGGYPPDTQSLYNMGSTTISITS